MINDRLIPTGTPSAIGKPLMHSESENIAALNFEPVAAPSSISVPETPVSGMPAETPQLSAPRRAINKASQIRSKMPKAIKMQLKMLFSVVMFGSLPFLLKIDPQKTLHALVHTNVWILGATAAVFILSILLNARRWQLLTQAVGFRDKGFIELTEYCYVGLFFNLFLPSTVGGDFSRCYYLSKGTGRIADALYTVLADRASGLAVLFVTATIGLLLGPGAKDLPLQLKLPVFVGTFGLFCIMPFMPKLSRRILGEENWITRRFTNPTAQILWKDQKLVVMTLAYSMVTQLVMVCCHIGVAAALGIGNNVPLWYYFVFYPCVAVLGFVTPSFNGIGIREWAYSYFLMLQGVPRELALTYALLWLVLTTVLSLTGGVVYAAAKLKPPPAQDEV